MTWGNDTAIAQTMAARQATAINVASAAVTEYMARFIPEVSLPGVFGV